jgi:hypothetical protein
MSKKLQDKQERRAAEQRRREAQRKAARRGNLVTVLIALVVVAAVAGIVLADRFESVGASAGEANCTGVETHEIEGNNHAPETTDVAYETTPPTSGDHYEQPADAGFYTSPVAEEQLVHNLEHGQIVIWYDPGAPEEVIADIEEVTRQEALATVAVPYEGLDEPRNLALTAWGASQSCEAVSQDVVDSFRARFQGRGPEDVGVPTFTPEQG